MSFCQEGWRLAPAEGQVSVCQEGMMGCPHLGKRPMLRHEGAWLECLQQGKWPMFRQEGMMGCLRLGKRPMLRHEGAWLGCPQRKWPMFRQVGMMGCPHLGKNPMLRHEGAWLGVSPSGQEAHVVISKMSGFTPY